MRRLVSGGAPIWDAMLAGSISPAEAWLTYRSVGGVRSQSQLVTYVVGDEEWPRQEHDHLAYAVNAILRSRDLHHQAPSARKLPSRRTRPLEPPAPSS